MSKHPLQFLEAPRRDPVKESAETRILTGQVITHSHVVVDEGIGQLHPRHPLGAVHGALGVLDAVPPRLREDGEGPQHPSLQATVPGLDRIGQQRLELGAAARLEEDHPESTAGVAQVRDKVVAKAPGEEAVANGTGAGELHGANLNLISRSIDRRWLFVLDRWVINRLADRLSGAKLKRQDTASITIFVNRYLGIKG